MYEQVLHHPHRRPIVAELPRRRLRIRWPRLIGWAGALALSVCAYAALAWLAWLAALLRSLPPIG